MTFYVDKIKAFKKIHNEMIDLLNYKSSVKEIAYKDLIFLMELELKISPKMIERRYLEYVDRYSNLKAEKGIIFNTDKQSTKRSKK